VFAASDLKKRVEKENLTHQYGTKPAGAEAIVHIFQQVILQNPDYDVFSADAVKAFYNLNRDITMRKLKEVAPQVAMCPKAIYTLDLTSNVDIDS